MHLSNNDYYNIVFTLFAAEFLGLTGVYTSGQEIQQ